MTMQQLAKSIHRSGSEWVRLSDVNLVLTELKEYHGTYGVDDMDIDGYTIIRRIDVEFC